jgi:hypothetical protein
MAAACLGVGTAPEAILGGLRRNAAGLLLLVEDLVGEVQITQIWAGGGVNVAAAVPPGLSCMICGARLLGPQARVTLVGH